LSTGATPFDITDIEAEEAPLMADVEFDDAERGAQIPKLRSFAVMMRSIDVAQAALARHQMAAYPPDVLIEVPRTACRSLDFHRATELIDLGHELAARALDRIEPEASD
jgi:NTE family protein